MKLYFAGADNNSICNNILQSVGASNRLLSFYSVNKNKFNPILDNCFLDSGAFSVINSNKKIDINSYIDFIIKNADKINIYATLDVIGDYVKTYENTVYMEEMGLSPLPVFHYNSPHDHLEYLVNKYDYIEN